MDFYLTDIREYDFIFNFSDEDKLLLAHYAGFKDIATWEIQQKEWIAIAKAQGEMMAIREMDHEFLPDWNELIVRLPENISLKHFAELCHQYPNRIEAEAHAALWMLKHNKEFLNLLV